MIKRMIKQGRQLDAPSRVERKISRLVIDPQANDWEVRVLTERPGVTTLRACR
jgi:hypothetical protein